MDAQEYMSHKEKVENLESELERLGNENKSIRLLLEVITGHCDILKEQIQKKKKEEQMSCSVPTKNSFSYDSIKRVPVAKQSRVMVRTNSDDKSLIVRDGFQWRKYGQKATKDNPSPRAYFRCSIAPRCLVKKKVQRCREDESFLVVTYEGEHNHGCHATYGDSSSSPCSSSFIKSSNHPNVNCPVTASSFQRINTLDLDLSGIRKPYQHLVEDYNKSSCRKIEEYVASLAKDPNFIAALAEAVAGSSTQQPDSAQT